MLAFMGLPSFTTRMSKEQRAKLRDAARAAMEQRLAAAVPFDPEVKWAPELTFQAAGFPTRSLWPVKPLVTDNVNAAEPDQLVVSPGGRFCYCEKVIPRGTKLKTFRGKQVGEVRFDGPLVVPTLHELDWGGEVWRYEPWMSLVPMEYLSLRAGTRLARGRVVVAGLGLGHQLVEVSQRRNVRSLVLIERDAELVEWLFPRLAPHLRIPVEVIVGDVRSVLPGLRADVALVDVFPGYGGNGFVAAGFRQRCPDIGRIWCWGGA